MRNESNGEDNGMEALTLAEQRNAEPQPGCLDRARVAELLARRELIFSDTRVHVAAGHLQAMADFVAAMERITALPGWQAAVLKDAPETARHPSGVRGVFFGYDFHITPDGPRLIEINTNAGGGFLNALLLQAQHAPRDGLPDGAAVDAAFCAMFAAEWAAAGRAGKPKRVAITDDAPAEQYLNPDFDLCRDLLLHHCGIEAVICDAADLVVRDGRLQCGGQEIDLVYNRLTDFLLDDPRHAALREAWLHDLAVVTPHPRAYALFADKRHLVRLGDDAWLAGIGVDAATRALVQRVVPPTERVTADKAEDLRARRKGLFFKPATGFGSKATYRGANVTTRVFADILAGDYVAQALVPPSTRVIEIDGERRELKVDLRCYAYAGQVQLVAARIWQGQTTNFRTPGGGFTPVVAVP